MNNTLSCFKKSALLISILSSIVATSAFAADDGFISDSETKVNFRYRFEHVDQDGQTNNAKASTLRSRISFKSGEVSHFSLNAEVDNVSRFGAEDYNNASGYNANTHYPVVADPTGTSLNQLNLSYKNDGTAVTLGRQGINLSNQRFVGGVAWRQNEQTYDGIRGQYAFNDALSVDYSYIYYVSRIFGPDGPKRGLDGDFHFVNAHYQLNKDHKLTGFAYLLDDENWANSNDTYGIDYNGKFGLLKAHASYAIQSNGDFDTNYYALDGTMKVAMFNVTLGLEQLGSDNGQYGFSTPLATGHKFQGFADKFLGTPKTGVMDYYAKLATKVGPVKVVGFYHQFDAVEGSQKYGSEIDLVASYKIHKTTTLLAKYADYNADDLATDTQKFWLMANMNFSL
ncbi:MAG: hypothetical protein HAW66_01690 [Shewanella sp.]|nr:hypothetical protein [Shewanella sp.]